MEESLPRLPVLESSPGLSRNVQGARTKLTLRHTSLHVHES